MPIIQNRGSHSTRTMYFRLFKHNTMRIIPVTWCDLPSSATRRSDGDPEPGMALHRRHMLSSHINMKPLECHIAGICVR